MARLFLGVAALLAAAGVAACRSSSDDVPVARGPKTTVSGDATQVYTQVARQIRACWFDPRDPVLTKHVFRAEAAPDGSATNIAIHEQTSQGRRGLKAFTVAFASRGRNTTVTAENRRLPYALGQLLVADVGRWASGDGSCAGGTSSFGARGSGAPSGVSQRIYEPGQGGAGAPRGSQ